MKEFPQNPHAILCKVLWRFYHICMPGRQQDGRKHFVTKCKDAKVDEYAIKYMVGHKISDITEKVYTAREFEWLRTEIEKIK